MRILKPENFSLQPDAHKRTSRNPLPGGRKSSMSARLITLLTLVVLLVPFAIIESHSQENGRRALSGDQLMQMWQPGPPIVCPGTVLANLSANRTPQLRSDTSDCDSPLILTAQSTG